MPRRPGALPPVWDFCSSGLGCALGEDLTDGQYLANIATFFKGWESPWHIHQREDEGLYVVRRSISAKLDDDPFKESERPGAVRRMVRTASGLMLGHA